MIKKIAIKNSENEVLFIVEVNNENVNVVPVEYIKPVSVEVII